MENLIQFFSQHVTSYGYVIGFIVSLLENSIFLGLLVPGDTVAILGGLYASQEALSLPLIIIALVLGSVVGDNLGFLLGRKKGREWLLRIGPKLGYKRSKIEQADRFWEKHGEKAIFIGDFVSYLRTFVPFLAGSSNISHHRFVVWDLLAVSFHAVVLVLVGYYFGNQWEEIRDTLGILGFLIFIVIAILIYNFLKRKGARHES